jgi:hypothetical protein
MVWIIKAYRNLRDMRRERERERGREGREIKKEKMK